MCDEELMVPGQVNLALDVSRDETSHQHNIEMKSLVSDGKTMYCADGNLVTSSRDSDVTDNTHDDGCCRKCCVCCSCKCECDCVPCTAPIVFCKVFHFSFVGAVGCILPYISLYMKQLGLSPQQIGLISGLRPIVGFCSAPLWGVLGDKYRIRKLLLIISLTAWFAFFVGLFHIPPPEPLDTCPSDPVSFQRRYLNPFTRRRLLADDNITSDVMSGVGAILDMSASGMSDPNATSRPRTPEEIETMTMYRGWMFETDSLWRVFVVCISLIVAGELFQSPTSALSDTGTLHTLELAGVSTDYYGSVRAWGAIGYGLSSFLAGALVSSSRKKEVLCGVELYFSDYRLLTYVFIGFLVLAFIAATQIKFKEGDDGETVELTDASGKPQTLDPTPGDKEKSHNPKAVLRIFMNVHYGSWLATSFFVGVCNGVIWGFLYWHLDNLGADQLMMGVSGIVVCLSEFIMFFLVGKVIKLIGHIGIMYAGLVGYSVRFCIYAVITNPWWVLPAEVLQGITFSIVWVSMTAYTTMAVPSASLATIQGILHGVYFGLGSGSGHLIGGLMIGYVGAVITFFSFAGASLVVLVLFAIAQNCSTKPHDVYNYKDLDEETETNSNVSKTDHNSMVTSKPDIVTDHASMPLSEAGDTDTAPVLPSDHVSDTRHY